ncbi:hypothetical protein K7432_014314 [Basidiobolus ranarum]|uniref:Condensation domain-containing protein n=1 Tax=Basidiobolus ranarum TaxID=34480 RepID=A0ABR2WI06_9FUNG
MTILAAWSVVLSRFSGQDDIVIGTLSAQRHPWEIKPMIGRFVNTLMISVDLSGNPSMSQLLERVCQFTEAAQAHQDLPFEQVLEIMGKTSPLQVMFALQNNEQREIYLPEIVMAPAEMSHDIVKFELDLQLHEKNDEI